VLSWWCGYETYGTKLPVRFNFISSLESDARKLGQAIRLHWELRMVCIGLDVTFKEDDCRVRTGHAPQNHILDELPLIL